MGLRDLFRKPASSSAAAAVAAPIASISRTDLVYGNAVSAANRMMADQIKSGQAGDMPTEQQAWFLENAGKPVNPTAAFGYTWYAHQDGGRMQLVDHSMLEMTGMTDPGNQPGMQALLDANS